MSELRELLQKVIDAKINRDAAIYDLKYAEAMAITDWLAQYHDGDVKALGPNEELRKAKIIEIHDHDGACRAHRSDLRDAERALLEAEADLESFLDVRRREREAVNRALADALALGGVVRDSIEDTAAVLR